MLLSVILDGYLLDTRSLPQPKLLAEIPALQDLADGLLFIDEGDDPHVCTKLEAEQRPDLVNLLHQQGPGATSGQASEMLSSRG